MYGQQMNNQSSGASGDIDRGEFVNRKFLNVGDEFVGVIMGQSGWMTGQAGTFRILNLQKGEDKFSIIIGTDGQKQAINDALEAAGLTDTTVGDQFKIKWTDERPTKSGRKFRIFEAKVKRS